MPVRIPEIQLRFGILGRKRVSGMITVARGAALLELCPQPIGQPVRLEPHGTPHLKVWNLADGHELIDQTPRNVQQVRDFGHRERGLLALNDFIERHASIFPPCTSEKNCWYGWVLFNIRLI